MTCKVCLWADTRTEHNRGIYRNMLRLRIRIFHIRINTARHFTAAIRPHSELISVSLIRYKNGQPLPMPTVQGNTKRYSAGRESRALLPAGRYSTFDEAHMSIFSAPEPSESRPRRARNLIVPLNPVK